MRKVLLLGAALALATDAFAAAGVANATQKGSLLFFPDIRVDFDYDTIVRIENDGNLGTDVVCYWLDGNKHRVDFMFPITKNQPVVFSAKTGRGTIDVNPYPADAANGYTIPNEVLRFPGLVGRRGALICFAAREDSVTADQPGAQGQRQVKWNHLSGTATVFHFLEGAYEYNAFAFNSPALVGDLNPIGTAGELRLNGLDYDACPQYLTGQFSPWGGPQRALGLPTLGARITMLGCNIDLRQDWTPTYTKLQFDIWNSDEIKETGTFVCADTWHEVFISAALPELNPPSESFSYAKVGTEVARYRVQGVASSQCALLFPNQIARDTVAVGLVGVQWTITYPSTLGRTLSFGTDLATAGKFTTNSVTWDPRPATPEAR